MNRPRPRAAERGWFSGADKHVALEKVLKAKICRKRRRSDGHDMAGRCRSLEARMSLDRAAAQIRALILMGVSGSGKSTVAAKLAQRLRWAFHDGDAFHPSANVQKMRAGHPLSDDDRWPWLRAIAAEIDRQAALGEHVVYACSALKRAYRDILVHGRSDVRIVYLRGDQDLIASRLAARKGHFMPPGLLDSQIETLEEPGIDENPIVVQIDGTVDEVVDRIVHKLDRESAARGLPGGAPQ